MIGCCSSSAIALRPRHDTKSPQPVMRGVGFIRAWNPTTLCDFALFSKRNSLRGIHANNSMMRQASSSGQAAELVLTSASLFIPSVGCSILTLSTSGHSFAHRHILTRWPVAPHFEAKKETFPCGRRLSCDIVPSFPVSWIWLARRWWCGGSVARRLEEFSLVVGF